MQHLIQLVDMSTLNIDSTNSLDSSCCATCKADVEISRDTIHGPSDAVYKTLARSSGYPDGAGVFKKEFESAKIRLDRMSATIDLLQAEKRRLEEIVEKYKVILHPIRTAPADILRHIFGYCAGHLQIQSEEDSHTATPLVTKDSLIPKEMPWVLGQVCLSWRSLVLSTPELWTTVSIRVRHPESVRRSISSNVLRLGLQLDRSQNHPLTVTIYCPKVDGSHNTYNYRDGEYILDENNPLLVLLCACSRRWRHLRLEGHIETMLARMTYVGGLLPELESLTIALELDHKLSEYERVNRTSPLETCFQFAPRLKSVSFSRLIPVLLKLPWGQISTFSLYRGSIVHRRTTSWELSDNGRSTGILQKTLEALANVEECSLFFDHFILAIGSEIGELHFSRLTTLALANSERTREATASIMRVLLAPMLSYMTITSPFSDWNALRLLVTRSECKLTSLVIPAAELLSPRTLSEVLSTLRDLTALELGFVEGMDNDHVAVFWSPVVPCLEKLSIVPTTGRSPSYGDFMIAGVLEYRWNILEDAGISRLRFVSLDRRIRSTSTRERLDALIAQRDGHRRAWCHLNT
ncbi:hypothetical protein VNI00_006801 [Paramarasmius palmivorus]|uniref:F-box domain-containing protein n=1 Tax=Paramarasmius palmivorus TaxID=297713 RepID=A0AAW0D485_9AGAR